MIENSTSTAVAPGIAPADESIAPAAERPSQNWLSVLDRGDETISIAMLRDAATLLADTLAADWYLAIEAAGDSVVDVDVGPATDVEASPVRWQFTADEVPPVLRKAISDRQSTLLDDWATTAAGEVDPVGEQIEIASAVLFPICDERRVLGALGAASRKQDAFRTEDMLLGESASQIVATWCAGQEAKLALQKTESQHAALLDTVDAVVLQVDADGIIGSINRAGEERTGFARQELTGRSIWTGLVVPEEIAVFQGAFDRLQMGETSLSFESFILTKQSKRRRVSWSITVLPQTGQEVARFLATGIDITTQADILEELNRTREDAKAVKKQLDDLRTALDASESNRQQAKQATKPESLPGLSGPSDRRTNARRPYPYRQRIAPIIAGRIPRPDEFQDVVFRDIGAGGFSFIAPDQPTNKRFVVALGAEETPTYLAAEVIHTTVIEIEGRTNFVVGCRYTAKVEM